VSTRYDVMLWAQRVIARKGQAAHVLLEVPADATADQAQAAFHKIARTSHPDLHRHGLTPEEMETLNSAYAAVAGAYQELRTRTMPTTSMKKLARPDEAPAATATPPGGSAVARPASITTPPGGTPVARPASATTPSRGMPSARPPIQTPSGTPPLTGGAASASGGKPEGAMSPKALIYYRKAEIALRRGDLKGAILQLKLGCATDPTSTFLRTALAEVETEVRKST
jgi:hypothetical protein